MSEPFPWARAMAIGFGVLRLSPEAFWRMTPRELAAALSAFYSAPQAPMAREAFNELMRKFPDRMKT